MENKQNITNIIVLILSALFCGIDLFLYFCFFDIAIWLYVCLVVLNILFLITSFVAFFIKKYSLLRTVFVAVTLVFVFSLCYQIMVWLGYKEVFSSTESIKAFIQSAGAWGIVVFFVIQFLQVVILPIPAALTTIAGALIFGPTTAMFVSLGAILLGSFVAFFIGRYLGEKVVIWIIGEEACKKYSKLLYEKGKYLFFLMMLFPFFPDDILCMIAGMTTMNLRFFTITVLIARPLAIIPTCYLGGGSIIPYSGWGLIVWGILIVLMAVLIFLSYKYQDKIEKCVLKMSDKITRKSKKHKSPKTENGKDNVIENEKDV